MHEEQKKRKQEVIEEKGDWPAQIIVMTSGRWNQEAEEQWPNQPAAERI